MLGDVGDDALSLVVGVAQPSECPRDRLVHDPHGPPANELLVLHEGQVGLDPRRVAVHHQSDRAGGSEHRRLRIAIAVLLAERDRLVPG